LVDIVSPDVRSRMMSGIQAKNTKPEMIVRRGLHRIGFRFRLHEKQLSGKPDLVFPKYRAVIFVNGCFWHRHDCAMFRLPSTRTDFWHAKLDRNVENDMAAWNSLACKDWRVAVVWECALRGKQRLPDGEAIQKLASWLLSDNDTLTIRGI
jgi:DNA mismatch endonuclease, patch repair protein